MSTIGADHPSYDPLPPIMTFSKKKGSSPSAVSVSLLRIILYLTLVDASTWHFHITVFVALNSGEQKPAVAFLEVVNF